MVALFINSPQILISNILKNRLELSFTDISVEIFITTLGECIMLHFESSCCVYWPVFIAERVSHIVNSIFFHLLVFSLLYVVTLCGVFAVLRADEANNKCTKQAIFFFSQHIVDSIMLWPAISAFPLKAIQQGILQTEFTLKTLLLLME